MTTANDCIHFKVSETFSSVDNLWTFWYIYCIGYMSSTIVLQPSLSVFFTFVSKVLVEVATITFISPYPLIYCLVRYNRKTFPPAVSNDLFRAQLHFAKVVFHSHLHGLIVLSKEFSMPPTSFCPLLSFARIILTWGSITISLDLSRDSRLVDSYHLCNLAFCKASTNVSINFVPLLLGQMLHLYWYLAIDAKIAQFDLFREYGVNRTPFFAHRRRNIRPPSAIDQALWAARPKGRPRAWLLRQSSGYQSLAYQLHLKFECGHECSRRFA